MLDQEAIERLSNALVSRAGGYLRNPVRQDSVTCQVCTTPVTGYRDCFACNNHRTHEGLADASAFLTYAIAGQQSAYVMRGYKARPPVDEHRSIVALLLAIGLTRHAACPDALAGVPVTHWASVPSLPSRPGEHPLHKIIGTMAPGTEVGLSAAEYTSLPRVVSPDHFRLDALLPRDSHVLLIDDTWTGGGHAQSAVLALRRAGAGRVSLLVVARWINKDFQDNARFLRGLSDHDYDPKTCPWTGGSCP
jgi:predicted amidophosphoribosyltransferase